MSALKFNIFCGNCFATIAPGSGIVLSCGDFLCSSCSHLDQNTCPVCNTNGVRTAGLSNPPAEVSKNMTDTANHLESIFTTLKFQLNHYKDTLSRASQKLVAMTRVEAQFRSRIEELERYIEQDSKRQRVMSPDPAAYGNNRHAMSPQVGCLSSNASERVGGGQHKSPVGTGGQSRGGAIWTSGSTRLSLPPSSPSVRSDNSHPSRVNDSQSLNSPQTLYNGSGNNGSRSLTSSSGRPAPSLDRFSSPVPYQQQQSFGSRPFTPQMGRPSSARSISSSADIRTPQLASLGSNRQLLPNRPSSSSMPAMPMTPVGGNTISRDSKDTFAQHDKLIAISARSGNRPSPTGRFSPNGNGSSNSPYREPARVLTPNSVLMQSRSQSGKYTGSNRLRLI